MDLLRGRGRAGAAPAEGPDLGTPRAHPGGPGLRARLGRLSVAGLACLKPGQPGRFFYRLRRAPRAQGRAPQHVRSRLRRPGHRRAPCPGRPGHRGLGQPQHPPQQEDAQPHRRARRLADRHPAARLRPGPQRRRGRLVQHEERPGQPRCPPPSTSSPRQSATASGASSDGPTSSTRSSARPASPSDPSPLGARPRPFSLCSRCAAVPTAPSRAGSGRSAGRIRRPVAGTGGRCRVRRRRRTCLLVPAARLVPPRCRPLPD